MALNRRNVVPVLDFLIAHGLQECNANRPAQVSVPPQLGLTSTMKGAHVYMTVVTPQLPMAGRPCIVCLQFLEGEVFSTLVATMQQQDAEAVETYLTVAKRAVQYSW